VLEEDVHQLPEDVVGGGVHLLHDAGVVRAGHERMRDRARGGDRAAVPAGQRDREQPEPVGRLQRPQDVGTVAVGRDPEGDVVRSGQQPQLMGEDLVEAEVPGHAGHGRRVGRERERGQRPLADDDRVHELDREVLGVGGGPAVAEHDQLAAAREPHRHVVTGGGDQLGVVGEQPSGYGPVAHGLGRGLLHPLR
jgi:hypothetical protein